MKNLKKLLHYGCFSVIIVVANVTKGGADLWQNVISATSKSLSELKFLTHTDVLTEPGSLTLKELRLLSTVHRVV